MNGSNRRLEIPRALLARPDASPAVQAWWACRAALSVRSRDLRPVRAGKTRPIRTLTTDSSLRAPTDHPTPAVACGLDTQTARVELRLTAQLELRWERGTLFGRARTPVPRVPLGPWWAADRCEPSERLPLERGVFGRACEEPFPPLASRDTRTSGRSLKTPPSFDRSRSRQRSTADPRPRTPSIDECPGTRFRGRLGPPPISRLRRLDSASGTRSPGSLRNPARRGADRGLITRAPLRQAPLVDFCNRNDPPARPWIGGSFGLLGPRTSLERRGAEYASLSGA
jgi:hypothetical protein